MRKGPIGGGGGGGGGTCDMYAPPPILSLQQNLPCMTLGVVINDNAMFSGSVGQNRLYQSI